jgi:hypothetical protein
MRALAVVSVVGCLALLQASGPSLASARVAVSPAVAAPAPVHAIPPRPDDAVAGSVFMRRLVGMPGAAREAAIVAEVVRGNIPEFLRSLKEVTLRGRVGGRATTATVWVMPDYVAIGADRDFVRVPVDFYSAVEIARAFGMAMPTRKMVDAIYSQSTLRLRQQPMTPGPSMTSTSYFLVHNERIETQRAGRARGALTAGHKKDLVLTNRLFRQRTPRVAIYGWHRGIGDPIQPLSTVHGATYADYSHGLRLIGGIVRVNGVDRPIVEALQDAQLGPLLTLEGTVRVPAELVAAAGAPTR